MRQIVLDTETTGLYANNGDRIIEIGCVEVLSRHVTENHFHQYINPERDSHPDALAVHGLTTEFLSDKPKFAEIAQAFCDYIRGAELIIHNAPFDIGFLNAELARLGMPKVEEIAECITDSLVKARDMFPGRRNSLDALCERFEISNAHRTLHGALLDSELLAEVYLAMTRGQETLEIGGMSIEEEEAAAKAAPLSNIHIVVLAATEEELARHEEVLDDIEKSNKGAPCVWRTEPVTADGALEAEPAK
ncbi:DNA polymerase III subunit epsilon [Oxalobacter formigenes]|uniref:DNA polymerase III subunit epsilon n=1 Tax=Oxalobacter formigenes OXCC13 TaxID=556269 RepID=C3X9S8_OXAFO|nr:DNA polymerase III subunit epsilon [Oxalobacter formigenes]ARQ45910.1 DNA polymerase III subunit epsilon [Oxalobacter formigenes]ARQ78126.1 DNA polymerase III subunit epsilon [Oxalobacter formigenes OXCC13]EEO29954.1 DNA polymerase III, epsilon subunit [Oxalobacter formigenes OXCC13]MCZ4062182.1 DNA polymerase III subunit epsilon [Oxalobacter formigenes]QDX33328.1 DNA polymerase III subunit epsilon [Oxalobacter formigenes]